MTAVQTSRLRHLISRLSENAGRPVVLDARDCALLAQCLERVQVLREALDEAEAQVEHLRLALLEDPRRPYLQLEEVP